MVLILSRKAIEELIIAPEVSSKDVYIKKYQAPTWPGGESGITIGIGYDLGYKSPIDVQKDLGGIVHPEIIVRLQKCAGTRGIYSRTFLEGFKDIKTTWEQAIKIFYCTSLRKYCEQALKIYPGLEHLHPYEVTAIVGLVYNRGASLQGDRRKEMRELMDAIRDDDDKLMASLIRQMKRLWGKEQSGLLARRDKEAAWIEAPDNPIPKEDELLIEI